MPRCRTTKGFRAKNADSGSQLRRDFEKKVGIKLPEGRRKADRQNAFTPLVERKDPLSQRVASVRRFQKRLPSWHRTTTS